MKSCELIDEVAGTLAQIEADTAAFRLSSGLRCPAGCGACCRSTKIHCTILEMLPAAAEILRRNEAEHWLEATGAAVCAAYSEEALFPSGGHCRLYSWRPSICRLFGFALVVGRRGRNELAACREMKRRTPWKIDRAAEAVSQGLPAPIFSGYSIRLTALDPVLGTRLIPINQALGQAIQRLGLSGQFDPSPGARQPGPRLAA